MPKIKEPRIPLKGEKPSKAPKLSETKRKAPPRSEEIVVESDSDGSTSQSSSGHSSGSESDAERRKNTKKPNAKKVAETEPTNPEVPEDSSEEEDESEEDESEDEVDGLQDPDRTPKINGTTKASKTRLDDTEMKDASDEDAEEEEQTQAAKKSGAVSHIAKSIPAAAFEPPPGYSLIDMKSNDGFAVRANIPDSDTTKQLWHITAPAGLTLADVKSFALSKIDSKQSVLSHKGSDYSIVEDRSASNEPGSHKHVLIPSANGKGYTPVKAPVSRTLHVQQIINLPNLSKRQANPVTGSNAAGEVNQPPIRGPKPQPKGLRMRYKPPGFGSGRPGAIGSDTSDDEDDDVEMADAGVTQTKFQLPTSSSQSVAQSSSKRKQDVTDTSSARKKKKNKDQTGVNGSAETSTEAQAEQAKEVAIQESQPLIEGTHAELPKTDAEEQRLRDEKAQRKEERRLKRERKEERRKVRESAVA